MVISAVMNLPAVVALSVLALSSRFDGRNAICHLLLRVQLSVLALSSRFDGPERYLADAAAAADFQYSLCRVVLMVTSYTTSVVRVQSFQYSLCRVVLMVPAASRALSRQPVFQYSLCRVVLMVRFSYAGALNPIKSFSTRSVESF